jgi:hypothetical protein
MLRFHLPAAIFPGDFIIDFVICSMPELQNPSGIVRELPVGDGSNSRGIITKKSPGGGA